MAYFERESCHLVWRSASTKNVACVGLKLAFGAALERNF